MENIILVFNHNVLPWLLSHGLRIAGIIAVILLLRRVAGIFVEKIVRKSVVSDHFLSKAAEKKREDTLIRVFNKVVIVILWVVGSVMIVSEFGVDIGPLVAGLGIAGVAVGFGAQYFIRDVIAGLFMIFENQFRIGDVVCLDSTCGLVEDITLRMTILRDLDGTVHHIPNGEVRKSSNLSKFFARVNLNIGVSYGANLEKVISVVNRVGNDLAQDPHWKEFIKKPPQFLRVEDFADSAVIIKILGETEPLKQWDVAGELRKRLKIAFDKEGIEIPFPQRVVRVKK